MTGHLAFVKPYFEGAAIACADDSRAESEFEFPKKLVSAEFVHLPPAAAGTASRTAVRFRVEAR